MQHDLRILADSFQLYLEDDQASPDLSEAWTSKAIDRLLAFDASRPHGVAIATVRNTLVPVTICIDETPPGSPTLDDWDQINECSIDLPSGTLVVSGCADRQSDCRRIALAPGPYRVRIHYGRLDSVHDDGLEGDDTYYVVLWPSPWRAVEVLKQHVTS